MNHTKTFQNLSVSFLALGAALFLAQLKCDASPSGKQEQQQSAPPSPTLPPSSQPASKPSAQVGELPVKRRKVWTNDDVVDIRTPADNYEMEIEAKKAADAKAAAKETAIRAAIKSEKQPPLDIKLPATVEQTDKLITDTQSDIQEETVILDKLRQELQDAPAEEKPQKQKEIDHLNGLLETSQRDLRALEDHLKTLRGKSEEENPPAPPPPPSS
ncbi:MAG: hypothetical protein WA817_06780 [Candidatus Acidiferrum sp.]